MIKESSLESGGNFDLLTKGAIDSVRIDSLTREAEQQSLIPPGNAGLNRSNVMCVCVGDK